MTTLSIPDMSCGHCRASIETALAAIPGAGPVRFDAEARTARVEGDAAPETLIAALDGIGFPATVLR
ncbi:heavy-metal-associated domain-containing protein [Cereibacter changlensis]|uniref:heavy-metal-associated domain-containing protein n=1 Tax=Cereibacter changlensis TaxID=402884 RepID=UPI004034E166